MYRKGQSIHTKALDKSVVWTFFKNEDKQTRKQATTLVLWLQKEENKNVFMIWGVILSLNMTQ